MWRYTLVPAPYTREALCLCPYAWEPSYTPGPYERGIALIGGSAPVYMRGIALYTPLYAGLCPIHAGKSPLYADKRPEKPEKSFAKKVVQTLYSYKYLGKVYNSC